jgi:hypothetical protein
MLLGLRRHNCEWRDQQRHDGGNGYAFEQVHKYSSFFADVIMAVNAAYVLPKYGFSRILDRKRPVPNDLK